MGTAFRVVIAGGGIAAAEALLALDDLAPDEGVEVELIAPGERFEYRPHLVAEPFGLASAASVELGRLAAEHRARLRRDALAGIDAGSRSIRTAAGNRTDYDALLIATGARPVAAVDGALNFGLPADREAFGALIGTLERGRRRRLAFAVPAGVRWSLPAYELALLSVAHLRARDVSTVEVTVATHEQRPLELLGEGAPRVVGDLLDEAGIELRTAAAPLRFDGSTLELAQGRITTDHVVALPGLEVPGIDGIPQRLGGFIPTDVRLSVEGLTDVWAAGDATWFPIKQGGLAAQQADVAAESIAARAGASVAVSAYRPVLRAALLTGLLPRYFRAALFAGFDAAASPRPLWDPSAKVAGRYLGPYLSATARRAGRDGGLVDLDPPRLADQVGDRERRRYDLDFALAAADADARAGDYAGALDWLSAVEDLTLVLPPAYLDRRESWREAARG